MKKLLFLFIVLVLFILTACDKKVIENKNPIIEAVKNEYVLDGDYTIEEITDVEWEVNTKCYKVINSNKIYYVAIINDSDTDVDDDFDTFCWLHKMEKKKEEAPAENKSYNFVLTNDSGSIDRIVLAADGYIYVQNNIIKELTKLSKQWSRNGYMILIQDSGSNAYSDIYYISNDDKILIKYIGDKPYIYIAEE